MPKSKRNLQDCLLQKFGFEKAKKTKHDAVALTIDGKQVAFTFFSRSWSDIDDKMLGNIARQLWVTAKDLRQMCECSISKEQYLALLRRSGRLS